MTTSTVAAGIVLLMLCGLFKSQLSAVGWHLVHGRAMTWDGHVLVLPIWWRPSSDASPRDLSLMKANTFGPDVELKIVKLGSSGFVKPLDPASKWQGDDVTRLTSHSRSPGAFKPYTVLTEAGEVYCIGTDNDKFVTSFACRVAGTDWEFRFLGDASAAADARFIVGSLR